MLFLFETNEMKQSEKIVVEINKPLLKTLTFLFFTHVRKKLLKLVLP